MVIMIIKGYSSFMKKFKQIACITMTKVADYKVF